MLGLAAFLLGAVTMQFLGPYGSAIWSADKGLGPDGHLQERVGELERMIREAPTPDEFYVNRGHVFPGQDKATSARTVVWYHLKRILRALKKQKVPVFATQGTLLSAIRNISPAQGFRFQQFQLQHIFM